MSNRDDKKYATFEKFMEEQVQFNKKVELQNKKRKNTNLIFIIVLIFVSGITSVASYSIGANSVGYTPKDSGWFVDNAQEAIDDLFDSVGSALVGSVYSYMGIYAPSGYLVCDGTIYNINDYPRLANHINLHFGSFNYFGGDGTSTFAVPDLRGEFLRGTGTNSHADQGSGASVGTHQDATVHSFIGANNRSGNVTMGIRTLEDASGFIKYNFDSYSSILHSTGYAGMSSTSANNQGLITSRPTNTSVLYIIKY